MRTRRQATLRDLRTAIDCLPVSTRAAMLDGIRSNDIIVGAYTSDGGVCPMLAAHRAGGRTNLISFAKAWDRFAFRDARDRSIRRATDRELLILKTHLEASLLDEQQPDSDLKAAVAEHRALLAERARAAATQAQARSAGRAEADGTTSVGPERPGDRDRSRELHQRPGWAWMRVFRRYEDYERALARLQSETASAERESEPADSRH